MVREAASQDEVVAEAFIVIDGNIGSKKDQLSVIYRSVDLEESCTRVVSDEKVEDEADATIRAPRAVAIQPPLVDPGGSIALPDCGFEVHSETQDDVVAPASVVWEARCVVDETLRDADFGVLEAKNLVRGSNLAAATDLPRRTRMDMLLKGVFWDTVYSLAP